MDERVIALTDLTKQYGRFTAVDRICLTIRKGDFRIIGAKRRRQVNYHPDDAGTDGTHFRLCGDLRYRSTRHPIEVKRKIGYLPKMWGFMMT